MLFEKILNKKNSDVLLKAFWKGDAKKDHLIEKTNVITEYLNDNEAYVYLGEKDKFEYASLLEFFKKLPVEQGRNYLVDVESFTTETICARGVLEALVRGYYFAKADLYNEKAKNNENEEFVLNAYLSEVSNTVKESFEKSLILAKNVNYARNLQITPPNILNSEVLASTIEKDFKKYKNLKVTVLNKKQIEDLKMGLLLSVNRGSVYEPRVVVIQYNGDPSSKEKTVMIGKGITFDSGGYSLKGPRHMLGMKYDMSGSAIVASTMASIAQLKPKKNVAAVMCITDNRVNGDASLPDSVWKAMNGKSVEINNTDAEGRLVMADGLVYGARKLNATRLIDVATLTGAILVALGQTYTGVWTTTDKAWNDMKSASERSHELIWRMPFDSAFAKNIKASKVADLKNTDLSGNAGSCSAAMFLKEFTDDVEYIHIDVAGTADINEEPQGPMIRTLTELALA
ncbi:M17 family metallopeptidase [Mycoplasma sp. Mirounga ES2805-ORL]|uniref:M17 family metallopeptidase n=1 Tax=Mycoplasma sp. Mirounga ES2805-ORL TaxID=754514 RepID=UPI00197C852F|nr:M17 family metallopeptidase [Mycoplasma sp. Mirounga ES2805-ORL]QSF13535.1 M17 family metallopeptidase [Mycoplasma sp. Mirounga ES2805-ORL]